MTTWSRIQANLALPDFSTVEVKDITLALFKNVYSPKIFVGDVCLDIITEYPSDSANDTMPTFLEIGCGCGTYSVFAALNGWKVTATDICPIAVCNTIQNIQDNKVNADILLSDMFDALPKNCKYDRIFFNIPLCHTPPDHESTVMDVALYDVGAVLLQRFIKESESWLSDKGEVFVVYSEHLSGDKKTQEYLGEFEKRFMAIADNGVEVSLYSKRFGGR